MKNKNDILELRGQFFEETGTGGGEVELKQTVNLEDLIILLNQLIQLEKEWDSIYKKFHIEPIITVQYKRIIPKSKRIQHLFHAKNNNYTLEIVGACFETINKNKTVHEITYHLNFANLNYAIQQLEDIINLLKTNNFQEVDGQIIKKLEPQLKKTNLSIKKFKGILVDCTEINCFKKRSSKLDLNQSDSIARLVTFYKNSLEIDQILTKFGIKDLADKKLDEYTYYLLNDEIQLLQNEIDFLISMSVRDITEITKFYDDNNTKTYHNYKIAPPSNEPVIGVIDSCFDTNAYFSDWVEYVDLSESNSSEKLTTHGTAVSSIIVDGVQLNPSLDDGCGNFKVKHFGVTDTNKINIFDLTKKIIKIVKENKHIKVWNFSLGSEKEINNNFISILAAFLDNLQVQYDVIFIIAGTNKSKDNGVNKIGSPADSINSLVVNACDFNKQPASYTRSGKVLSFFTKPDVSYYGGDNKMKLTVCEGAKIAKQQGTSFAAAWISRKIGFLIYRLGLSKEVAKALIIDSTLSFTRNKVDVNKQGFGIVPININDVVNGNRNEIKFFIQSKINSYKIANLSLPVPVVEEKFPYVAKVTLCYFTSCDRNQGVDYTGYELDLQLGPVLENNDSKPQVKKIDEYCDFIDATNHCEIETINQNYQDSEDKFVTEKTARDKFEKWNNVKVILAYDKTEKGNLKKAMKSSARKTWGIKLTRKSRKIVDKNPDAIAFGLVVTLKNLDNENRIQEFINQCILKNWTVNKINIEQRLKIYNQSQEDIILEEEVD